MGNEDREKRQNQEAIQSCHTLVTESDSNINVLDCCRKNVELKATLFTPLTIYYWLHLALRSKETDCKTMSPALL
jgi:hypothetical protein